MYKNNVTFACEFSWGLWVLLHRKVFIRILYFGSYTLVHKWACLWVSPILESFAWAIKWVLHLNFPHEFYTWILHMNFTHEFSTLISHMNFTLEFYTWILHLNFTAEFYIRLQNPHLFAPEFYTWNLHLNFTPEFYTWILHMNFTQKFNSLLLHPFTFALSNSWGFSIFYTEIFHQQLDFTWAISWEFWIFLYRNVFMTNWISVYTVWTKCRILISPPYTVCTKI